MSTKPDNPPAFPMSAAFSPECGTLPGQVGMTLRDYFAGQVLAGYTAVPDTRTTNTTDPKKIAEWRKRMDDLDAQYCYRIADAMLRAREQSSS